MRRTVRDEISSSDIGDVNIEVPVLLRQVQRYRALEVVSRPPWKFGTRGHESAALLDEEVAWWVKTPRGC